MTAPSRWARKPAAPVLYPPRNVKAIEGLRASGKLQPRDSLIVSFIGDTEFEGPHLYADPGRRYDWRLVDRLYVTVVVKPGIDVRQSLSDIYRLAYSMALVDFESKVAGWLRVDPMTLAQVPHHRPGGSEWKRLFA